MQNQAQDELRYFPALSLAPKIRCYCNFEASTGKGEVEISHLSLATDIPLGLLSSKLLSLEFEGIAKSLPGKKYRLLV